MFMRTFNAGLLLALASCSGADTVPEKAEPAPDRKGDAGIACALAGAKVFEQVCAVEQDKSGEALILTLLHPDGGFRRLEVTGDGQGVVAADGAEGAIVSLAGTNLIEVSIAADRYRLPATVKR
jgi:hypothetical protein